MTPYSLKREIHGNRVRETEKYIDCDRGSRLTALQETSAHPGNPALS
jgi:hypothetical protein